MKLLRRSLWLPVFITLLKRSIALIEIILFRGRVGHKRVAHFAGEAPRRVRFAAAILSLTALGFALLEGLGGAAPSAAPSPVAPAWGKVLIAGGLQELSAASPIPLSSTELYDPVTNSFAPATNTADMNIGRYSTTATLLVSGDVLIAGGVAENDPRLSPTELFDPAINSFTPVGVMNSRRLGATATLLSSGKVLIAGGTKGVYLGVLYSTELYDPTSNRFIPAATMNSARLHATATLLPSGKVLIAGGSSLDGMRSVPLSSTELFDPATNTFASAQDTASMNIGRFEATATLLRSGKVLIAGGHAGIKEFSSTELYDPATNSFASPHDTAVMNIARYDATATLLPSGKVLIAGGLNSNRTLSSTELYDPATNTFARPAETAEMNTARTEAVAVLLPPTEPSQNASKKHAVEDFAQRCGAASNESVLSGAPPGWKTYVDRVHGFAFAYPPIYKRVRRAPSHSFQPAAAAQVFWVGLLHQSSDGTIDFFLEDAPFNLNSFLKCCVPTGWDTPPDAIQEGPNTFYYYGPGGMLAHPDQYFFNLRGKTLYIVFDGPYLQSDVKTPSPETKEIEDKMLSSFCTFQPSN
jgi:hypothetical protein